VADLESMIASARKLGRLNERAAEIAAPLLEARLRAMASQGVSPDGKPWAPRVKDGGRAMRNAASAISVRAIGPTIRVTLDGVEVFHHFGRGATEVRRPVIPDQGGPMPDVVREVLEEAMTKAWAELTG
jgi:hypothetical protein